MTGRVYDQIRCSVAYSESNVKLVATHAGITVGEDGATHQMLEDISLMRALPNMYVYTASTDMVTKKLIEKIAKDTNPTYVRLYRMETEEHYENLTEKEMEKHIENGMIVKGIKGKDLKEHQAILFTMGDMIDIVYNVQKELEEKHGISSLVIDVIRLKPFNEEFVVKILNVISDAKIVTIEDHSIYGGLRKYNI